MAKFLKYNILSTFFGLLFTTFIIGLINEDLNTAGLILAIYLMPIFGVVCLNLFIVGILSASEKRLKKTLGLFICPAILFSYSFYSPNITIFITWAIVLSIINTVLASQFKDQFYEDS